MLYHLLFIKILLYSRGKVICEKLKRIIPKQMFEVPVQATLQGKIIARTTIKAMRKTSLLNVMVEIFRVKRNF